MSFELNISLAGDEQLRRRLGITITAMKDWRPAFRAMSGLLNKFHVKVFKTSGAHSGKKWAPLALGPPGAKNPVRGYWKPPRLRDKPLILSGNLQGSLTSTNASSVALRIFKKRFMEWGIKEDKVFYAKFHQTGTPNMPARPPLRLTKEMRKEVGRIAQSHLFDALRKKAGGNRKILEGLKRAARSNV